MTGKLTKSQSKFVNSLKQKKYRDQNRCFVVEGIKMVEEVLRSSVQVEYVVFTGELEAIPFSINVNSYQCTERELSQISSLKTPNRILAVCQMPNAEKQLDFTKPIIALDGVKDPGNLGTIIRICDWFGFDQLLCGTGTVDQYNAKVVQSTMGSLFRVGISYDDLASSLAQAPDGHPVFYADMGGAPIYSNTFPAAFTLVMGSESHGVSEGIRQLNSTSIAIPQYGAGESLNVAVSTGIICAEIKRQH